MCIRCEAREKARRSLAFSRVSKPHTHITYMLRPCTSIVYILVGIEIFKWYQSSIWVRTKPHLRGTEGDRTILHAWPEVTGRGPVRKSRDFFHQISSLTFSPVLFPVLFSPYFFFRIFSLYFFKIRDAWNPTF